MCLSTNNHVYALVTAERFYVINIEDPSNPYEVGMFEIGEKGQAIHDVWIEDGIAYYFKLEAWSLYY